MRNGLPFSAKAVLRDGNKLTIEKTAWLVQFMVAGKKKYRQFPTERKARAFTHYVGDEVKKRLKTAESESGQTLQDVTLIWVQRLRVGIGGKVPVEEGTAVFYQGYVVRHINHVLGKLRLPELTIAHVRTWRDDLLGGALSRTTVKKILTTLKTILNFAVYEGLVGSNVAAGVKVYGAARAARRIEIHTKDEMRIILDEARRLSAVDRV